ncbi:MAG: polymer-forming cytoskeletal protein [Alphaproteobacteria bacterium]|nr:polymer-forming cytoskeletal protein [Alphaproteobacteria bacterium]
MAGNVSYEGTVQVDGLIEGDVTASRIVVTADATVNGTVKGKTVRVDGTINGPIDGGTVILAPTACVKGNIDYDMLNIVSGASVFGLCRDKREARPTARMSPADADPIPFNLVKNFPRHSRALPPNGYTTPRAAIEPGPHKSGRPESMMDVWESYTQDEPSVV